MKGKERAPSRECPCFDLHLHMQREGRQWTQTTRALFGFLVFLIIAYPVLAVTCPPCPPALRHCRVARNSSRGRHVVFVAQCNGWVLHVISNITDANINHPTAHRRRVPARPWVTKEEVEERRKERGGGRPGKGRGKNDYACAAHRQAPRSSASSILGVPGEHESGNDGRCRGVSLPSSMSSAQPRAPPTARMLYLVYT